MKRVGLTLTMLVLLVPIAAGLASTGDAPANPDPSATNGEGTSPMSTESSAPSADAKNTTRVQTTSTKTITGTGAATTLPEITSLPVSEGHENGSNNQTDSEPSATSGVETSPTSTESTPDPSATNGEGTSPTSTESSAPSADAQNTTRVQTTSTRGEKPTGTTADQSEGLPVSEGPDNGSNNQTNSEPSATSGVDTSPTSSKSTPASEDPQNTTSVQTTSTKSVSAAEQPISPPASEAPANGRNNQTNPSPSTAATTQMPGFTPTTTTSSESTAATTPTSTSTAPTTQSKGRTKTRKRPFWDTKNDGATYYDHRYCWHLVLEASNRLFTTACQKICGRRTQNLKNHTPCLRSVRFSPRTNSGNFKTCAIGSCIRGRCVISSYYTHCNFPDSTYYYYYDNHRNRDKVYDNYYQ